LRRRASASSRTLEPGAPPLRARSTCTPSPSSQRCGKRRLEPLISLQWSSRMERTSRRPRSTSSGGGRSGSTRIGSPALSRLAVGDPPVGVSRQLWWGHQIPSLVTGGSGEEVMQAERARGDAGPGPPTSSHVVSSACAVRDARWAEQRPQCRASIQRRAPDGAQILVLCSRGGMAHDGDALHGRHPVRRVSCTRCPGARGRRMSKRRQPRIDRWTTTGPAPAGEGSSYPPARRLPATAPTPCASACWRCLAAGSCAQRGEDCQGRRCEKLLQRDALRSRGVGARRGGHRGRELRSSRRSPRHRRGSLDPSRLQAIETRRGAPRP